METANNYEFSEKNYEHLAKQIKFTGVGDKLQMELLEQMKQGKPEFTLSYKPEFGKEAEATLHFRMSDKGNYFFNSYNMAVRQEDGSFLSQNFRVSGPQRVNTGEGEGTWVNSTITMKEAFNMLEGRFAFKDYVNKEGAKYSAWTGLDFKDTDQQGNYLLRKFPEYDLRAKLSEYHVKAVREGNGEGERALMESLYKGNRQAATLAYNGLESERQVQANPQYKTATFFEGEKRLSKAEAIAPDKRSEQQDLKEGKSNKQAVSAGPDEETVPEQSQEKKRGRKVRA
ncbi:hypothetical protein ACFJIV_29190 [Mucilaginibacter sp. UC70_90]